MLEIRETKWNKNGAQPCEKFLFAIQQMQNLEMHYFEQLHGTWCLNLKELRLVLLFLWMVPYMKTTIGDKEK